MTPKRKAEAGDRVLPHNLEAEKAVLGSLLVNSSLFPRVASILTPEHFYRRAHADIYRAIVEVVDGQRAVADLVTVKDALARAGVQLEDVGGAAYVSSLTTGVPKSANVAHYGAIVREKWTLRELVRLGNDVLAEAYDAEASAEDVLASADRAVIELQRGTGGRMVSMRATTAMLFEDIEYRVAHKGELTGVDTGFASVNEVTNGWQAGEMIVVGARPSIGKTVFALNTAVAAARAGKRVGIFSLEMRREQLQMRILSSLSGVPETRISRGYLGDDDFAAIATATGVMSELDLSFDDAGHQTIWTIRNTCRRLKSEGGLDLVIIDYIQLVSGSLERRGANRNEELTDISRRTKELTDEVACPIIVLSQLKRLEGNRRPTLQDLRESGSLEQDADIVAFLHRKNHRESGTTSFIVEKQRNGSTGTVNLTINRDTQTFTDGGADTEPEAAPETPPADTGAEKPRRRRR